MAKFELALPDTDAHRVDAAVVIARALADEAGRIPVSREVRRAAEVMRSSSAVAFVSALTDEVTRIPDAGRAAARFRSIVREQLPPAGSGLRRIDLLQLWAGARVSAFASRIVMPIVLARLRRETRGLIVNDGPRLAEHLRETDQRGFRANTNALGEAILGPYEAAARLDKVLALVRRKDVNYVSVKLSAIVENLSALAYEGSIDRASERLRTIWRAGITHDTFVNLDMEEYRDLDLTVAAFTRVLGEPEFHGVEAGIVLQAYLPDSATVAEELGSWARRRVDAGGAAIKVRVVKGANLAMEGVEAELRGWELATFGSKEEVDANYKHVIDVLLRERFDGAVRVGLASHNLFDVAWGLVLRNELTRRGQQTRLEFEMLQGMAPAQAEALRRRCGSVLLYTPVVGRDDFTAAIAYLVRRLDENTAPENFLAHLSTIATDEAEFREQESRFRQAVKARISVDATPRRQQNRTLASAPNELSTPFANEPDTDFSLDANRLWIAERVLPLIDTCVFESPREFTVAEVDGMVDRALSAQHRWAATSAAERASIVNRIGDVVGTNRAQILAAMAVTTHKTIAEGDPEISEAVDFARYYAREALRIESLEDALTRSTSIGPVVVAPPWNFPYAIAFGGVTAALAAGNVVILKPAPQAVAVQRLIAEHCWAAGVDRDVLQFLPIVDGDASKHLITHENVAAVVLTGAWETAQMFLGWRPGLRLFGETSGKNALVITATADVDLALKDLVKSAFGHAGQKCSAASVAIVEGALYDDAKFLERLADAVRALRCGPATELSTDIPPLIGTPSPTLLRALTTLEQGEDWLLQPRLLDEATNLWSPGIRIGVRRGSWFAQTECFGPVLGVIRACDLDEAIAIQNDTDYGLTAGLHALDSNEIRRWVDAVQAGNVYVNRSTTGAIVRRQPFGGWKRSSVGSTTKAGGPLYVSQFRRWNSDESQIVVDEVRRDYQKWWHSIGSQQQDASQLVAESNRYHLVPLPGPVMIRAGVDSSPRRVEMLLAAAKVVGVKTIVSDAREQSESQCVEVLRRERCTRVRVVGASEVELRFAAHAMGVVVDDREPVAQAAVEIPRWTREQIVSETMHRHGHVRRER